MKNITTEKFLYENKLKAIYSYNDLENEATKKTILNDLKDLSGVYLVLNKETSDFYVGSASTGKFYSRFMNHLFYFKGSKIVKHAVKKYGIDKFSFIVLEVIKEVTNKANNKDLLDLEDYYLKSLTPNYNILTEAGSNFGYKHTEITRIKMKATYSLERRMLIGNLNKGKSLTEETKNKIRNKKLGLKLKYSDEGLLNMKKKSKAIVIYNKNYTVHGSYPSIKDAALGLNCNEKTIIRALKSEKKLLLRKYIVNYKN